MTPLGRGTHELSGVGRGSRWNPGELDRLAVDDHCLRVARRSLLHGLPLWCDWLVVHLHVDILKRASPIDWIRLA